MQLTTFYATSSLSYSPPCTHTSFSHQPNGSSRRCLEARKQICPGKSVVCTTTGSIMTQLPFPFLSSLPLHLIRTQQTMFSTLRLQVSNPVVKTNDIHTFAGNLLSRRRISGTVPPARRFTCLSLKSNNAAPPELQSFVSTQFTSSVGLSPSSLQLSHWNLTHRNINVLNAIALVTAISATWLFCSAIPTLLAFKRAAESLEKLLDVTREELPGTMAAVRLSGMEISDLTMELSDLGQEITQGVRNSTRAVRMAEERLRGLTNMTPPAIVQGLAIPKIGAAEPLLARSARGLREGIVKGRSLLQLFFTLTRFSKMALNYFSARAKS